MIYYSVKKTKLIALLSGAALFAAGSLSRAVHERSPRTPAFFLLGAGGLLLGCCTMRSLDSMCHMAEHDYLTRLMNRRSFDRKGRALFNQLSAAGGNASLFMMDLDFFGQVNNRCGHSTGDEVLEKVAQILSSRFRSTDLLARYGGEEFCAFLPHAREVDALRIAEEIRSSVAEAEFCSKDEHFRMSISIGVTAYAPERHRSLEDMLRDADKALYRAKERGRNRVVVAVSPAKKDAGKL